MYTIAAPMLASFFKDTLSPEPLYQGELKGGILGDKSGFDKTLLYNCVYSR